MSEVNIVCVDNGPFQVFGKFLTLPAKFFSIGSLPPRRAG